MEENFEIVDLVQQCLENDGVLRDIRSQLRASVFKAIMKTSNTKKSPLIDEFAKTTDGQLILGLVGDLLEILELRQTKSVFEAEVPKGILTRSDLLKKLNIDDQNKTPILQLHLKDLDDKINKSSNETLLIKKDSSVAPAVTNNDLFPSYTESRSIDKISVIPNRSTSGRLRSAIKSYGLDELNEDNYPTSNTTSATKGDTASSLTKNLLSSNDEKDSKEISTFPTKNETIKLTKLTPLPSLSSLSNSNSNNNSTKSGTNTIQPKDSIKNSVFPIPLDNSTSSFEESESEIGLSTSSTLQPPRMEPLKDLSIPPTASTTTAGSHKASERIQQFGLHKDVITSDDDDDEDKDHDFDQSLEIDDSFAESSFNNHDLTNINDNIPLKQLPKYDDKDIYNNKKTVPQNIWDKTSSTKPSTKIDQSPEDDDDEEEVEEELDNNNNNSERERNSGSDDDSGGSEEDFNYTTQKKKISSNNKLPESKESINGSTSNKSKSNDKFFTDYKNKNKEEDDIDISDDFLQEASGEDLDLDVHKSHFPSTTGTTSNDESSSQDPLQTSHRSSNQDEEEDIDGSNDISILRLGSGKGGNEKLSVTNPRSPQDSDGGGAYGEDEDFEEEDPELSAVEEVESLEESLDPSQDEEEEEDDMSAGGGQDSDDDKDMFGNKRQITKQTGNRSSSSLFTNSNKSNLSSLPSLGRGSDSNFSSSLNKKYKDDDNGSDEEDDRDRERESSDSWMKKDNSKLTSNSNSSGNLFNSARSTSNSQLKKNSANDDEDLQSMSGDSNDNLSVGGASDSEGDNEDASQGFGKGNSGVGDSTSMDFSVSDQEVSTSGALNDYDYTTTNMKSNKGKFSY